MRIVLLIFLLSASVWVPQASGAPDRDGQASDAQDAKAPSDAVETRSAPAPAPIVTRYQDWQVRCIPDPDRPRAAPKECIAVQDLSVEHRLFLGRPFLSLRIGLLVPDRPPVLEVVLPLGVSLQPGLDLLVGPEAAWSADFARCTMAGCSAVFPLSGALDTALRDGSDARIRFRDGEAKPFVLPFSLLGYRDARHALALPAQAN